VSRHALTASRRPAREESGFSLIELLIALVVLAILLAIAVPSYLGFDRRADRTAAQANLRAALPALTAYWADNDSYAGVTPADLETYAEGVSAGISVLSASTAGYCLRSTQGGASYYKDGPGGPITPTACS
jgi:prepilin-type N-terminal cleavage/methylation domain-containing protein